MCVAVQKLLTFFSKNITMYRYAIFNDQSFNDTLTNDILSFEQLGPGFFPFAYPPKITFHMARLIHFDHYLWSVNALY